MKRKYFSRNTYFVISSIIPSFIKDCLGPYHKGWKVWTILMTNILVTEFSKFKENIDKTQLSSLEQVQHTTLVFCLQMITVSLYFPLNIYIDSNTLSHLADKWTKYQHEFKNSYLFMHYNFYNTSTWLCFCTRSGYILLTIIHLCKILKKCQLLWNYIKSA